MKRQLRDWLDSRRLAIVARLAGGDPQKTVRIYAAAVFLMGLIFGCLLMLIARPIGLLLIALTGGGLGYGARAFVSYRRREAARARRISDGW